MQKQWKVTLLIKWKQAYWQSMWKHTAKPGSDIWKQIGNLNKHAQILWHQSTNKTQKQAEVPEQQLRTGRYGWKATAEQSMTTIWQRQSGDLEQRKGLSISEGWMEDGSLRNAQKNRSIWLSDENESRTKQNETVNRTTGITTPNLLHIHSTGLIIR